MIHSSTANWLSSLPTTVAVAAAVLGASGLSTLGLLCVNRLVPHPLRSAHNDVSGFMLAIVGVIYAVLLAFIAVAVWENFGKTENLVRTEANLIGDLYRDTAALPDPLATQLRDLLFVYAEIVVQDEWPAMAKGRTPEMEGWQLLDRFHASLVQFHTDEVGVAMLRTDMVSSLNSVYDARRGRLDAATQGLPSILWWNLLAGAVLLMVFTYLFGVPQLSMHIVMVSLLGASIGLILALIVLLNSPFRGQSHISSEPFDRLVREVEQSAYPH